MDDDNLVASFKALRDGIADRLGFDDGSDHVHWVYKQVHDHQHNVRVYLYAKRIEKNPAPLLTRD